MFNKSIFNHPISYLLLVICSLLLVSCGEGSTDAQQVSVVDFLSTNNETAANINVIAANLQPESLVIDPGASDNPCVSSDGVFDCQPALLKLYVDLAKQMVDLIEQVVTDISTDLVNANINPGDSGAVTVTSNGETLLIYYSVTSFSNYQILIKNYLDVSISHVTVNSSNINVVTDLALLTGSQASGILDVKINYTDQSNFDVDVALVDIDCDPVDVHAPQNMLIKIGNSAGVLKGKAMMYLPRWLFSDLNPLTCADEPTVASKATLYTDFVGDVSNTSAAIFIMPTTVSVIADIPNYPGSSFCTNFPAWCLAGFGLGDVNPVSSYANNFCITNTNATWNMACNSSVTDIATPNYSASSNWISPADFASLVATVPNNL